MSPLAIVQDIVQISQIIYTQVQLAQNNRKQLATLDKTLRIVMSSLEDLTNVLNNKQFIQPLTEFKACMEETEHTITKIVKMNLAERIYYANLNKDKIAECKQNILNLIPMLNLGINAQMIIDKEQDRLDKINDAADDKRDFVEQKQALKSKTIWATIFRKTTNTVPEMAFGKAQWETYFGDIGEEPPLPSNIQTILNQPCPIFTGAKISESHILTLIPRTVNGEPLTIRSLGELVKNPREGSSTQYRSISNRILEEHGDCPTEHSHWVLMTKTVLPTMKDYYKDNEDLIADIARHTGNSYVIPKLLEAAISVLMHHVRTGERLLSWPSTYIHCQEQADGFQTRIGDFSLAGLDVGSNSLIETCFGLAKNNICAVRSFDSVCTARSFGRFHILGKSPNPYFSEALEIIK